MRSLIQRSSVSQALIFVFFALIAGFFRPQFPQGILWNGRWPDSSTSSEEAYNMMAQPGDPAFISLSDVMDVHAKNGATFIDARSSEEFSQGRIPSSKNLPFYEMEKYQTQALEGLSFDSPLVIYCEGVGCELSFFLGRELLAAGFKNIKIFYGGYPEWKNAGLPIEK